MLTWWNLVVQDNTLDFIMHLDVLSTQGIYWARKERWKIGEKNGEKDVGGRGGVDCYLGSLNKTWQLLPGKSMKPIILCRFVTSFAKISLSFGLMRLLFWFVSLS